MAQILLVFENMTLRRQLKDAREDDSGYAQHQHTALATRTSANKQRTTAATK